jgi:hypothetical protein
MHGADPVVPSVPTGQFADPILVPGEVIAHRMAAERRVHVIIGG